MKTDSDLARIFAQDPQVMSGALVFRGTRIPVQTFFEHLDQGGTIDEFLAWYEGVSREQLTAAASVRTREPAAT
ncbi:MAG: DUF433 domain-containing protein [Opitutaceae bacterium]|nr:DUF433 domain-containing protein [Opitutaceae bacterium]